MNRSALLMLVPLLAGCNVHSKNPANGDEKVSLQANESGQIAFKVPFAEGKVKIPGMAMNGGHMDIDGVAMMPGSRVTGFNLDAGDQSSTVRMNFTAPASPDQVRSYFVDQFNQKGGKAVVAGDSVTGKSKDGSPFVIRVTAAQQGSQGTIEIHSND